MSHRAPSPAAVLALGTALALAACALSGPSASPAGSAATSPGGSASAPTGATPTPASSLPVDAIAHPAGPDDIVLRAETRGGFVMIDVVMARLPLFTLYGDGRSLVAPDDPNGVNPGGGGPIAGTPLREVRLSETDVQALLAFALTDGRLGVARDTYIGGNFDLPSTVFEVHAGGVDKTVSVAGLSAGPASGRDAADLVAFAGLVDQLRTVRTAADYLPSSFVAAIAETEAGGVGAGVETWPWRDLAPAEFAQPGDEDAIPFPKHPLTAAQVAALGVDVGPGGLSGLHLAGPDGRTYVVAIRPALPEDSAGG
jgi:hypothetical protein